MLVTSGQFFILLVATLLALAIVPARWRKGVLIAASIIFYTASGILPALFIAGVIFANFLFLRGVISPSSESSGDRVYLASMIFNAALLFGMKFGFEAMPAGSGTAIRIFGLSLGYPLGLSFIIPMLHGAITDAHSGKYEPRITLPTYFLFGGFFSYVSSGPIERLHRMAAPFDTPARPSLSDLGKGISLIALGLVKKIVVANRLQAYVDSVFSGDLPNSTPTMLLAIIFNVVYLYADFSGYTDIARGAARCMGFELLPNFDQPFVSRSMTEFWRRWHISFSTWLRDYLYMPLAFLWRRAGRLGQSSALLVTFLLCGVWHRAAGTFVLFGLAHGCALVAETRLAPFIKAPEGRRAQLLWGWSARFYACAFVCATEVLFSARSLSHAGSIFSRTLTSHEPVSLVDLMAYKGPLLFLLMLLGIAIWQVMERWQRRLGSRTLPIYLTAALLALLFIGQPEGGGFIYVQF